MSASPSGDLTAEHARDAVVACGIYVDGVQLPGHFSPAGAVTEIRERGTGFVWIGLFEPDEEQIRDVADAFGLHPLAVEDAVHAHQRPKLENYGDNLFMVFKTIRYVEHESPTTTNEIVKSGEIMVFLGKDYVVTVRHGSHSELHDVRQALEDDPERLAVGPAAVLHDIADRVVDNYLEVVELFQNDIDLIEAAVFEPRSTIGVTQMYLVKREILELRRAVMPLAGPVRKLAEGGCSSLVPEEVRSYFRNVDDHLTTVNERVTSFNELLTTLVDATLAKVSLQQNNDMRRISAWVAIVAVPTMGVGVYGMNFDYMPELRWKYGYPMVMSLLLMICLLLYRLFKRNRWL
ncbi:magnesium transporter [Lentzea guizhouensis]|uniref:Magnesium transporter n=1 Tax=Lentzea guizhouensis TaxID=1586287 RepID=A0A1B2I0M5_9PSEU|nr:magnesium and cobalt transport protein CorA [Lentzea guizhouensis]ANZ43483.1 magnesium transporter [Lentzea guizhouensis]